MARVVRRYSFAGGAGSLTRRLPPTDAMAREDVPDALQDVQAVRNLVGIVHGTGRVCRCNIVRAMGLDTIRFHSARHQL